MGLIKDIIGSALASDEPKNGFRSGSSRGFSASQRQYSQYSYGRDAQGPPRSSPNYNGYDDRRAYQRDDGMYGNNMYNDNPPPYSAYQGQTQGYDSNGYSNNGYNNTARGYNSNDEYYPRAVTNSNNSSTFFRPLALPQLSYGDGQPFLRGYSNELQQYNISFDDFMRTLDAINVAIIPSPENQIFQKGANIAGFFVPGAASIGLMVGQLGVGVGAAVGQSAGVSKVLSKANLEIFVPNGLEICIGKSKDVDNEVGISSNRRGPGPGPGARPEDRIAFYGNRIAPISTVLPPLSGGGRSDPLAMLGQRFSDRDNDRKMRRAQRKMEKGKTDRFDSLEGSLQWVMVRRASPAALDHWQQMLQKSDGALRQGYQDRKGNGMAQTRN